METTAGLTRRLSAILSIDAVGYSRLMRDDDEATVETLTTYRRILTHLIEQYRGRVVDSPGDNMLAEFSSVVDAVNCGVEIQRELAERNAELDENRRMPFRIGINMGDVLEEGGRIYGDGVNVAARMEGLAEAGEICISGTVYDAVESKIGLEYEFLGEHEVKNIDKPIRAYRVLSYPGAAAHRVVKAKRAVGKTWRNAMVAVIIVLIVGTAAAVWYFGFHIPTIERASENKMAFSLPDKPSIAVLPFENMSDDQNQQFFSDGLAEEIITALSKVPKLFVIARNSSFSYKGKSVKVNKIAEDLGVRYILEGSVRKEGDRVRITAQLIDALSGRHLWAERYDRDFKDIFSLQDAITKNILTSLQVKLTDGEYALISAKGTENLEAYLKILQAREHFYTITKEGFAEARRLCEEAVVLDPKYAAAYVHLGATHFMDVRLGSIKSPQESFRLAFEAITKAKTLDDSYPMAASLLGFLYVMKRDYSKAIAECERAVALEPNSGAAHMWMSLVFHFAGNHEEAVRHAGQALRLDPFPVGWWFRALGLAYFGAGRYEEAIEAYKKALRNAPDDILTHLPLTTAYSWAGHLDEARIHAAEVLRINPKFNLEGLAKKSLYRNPADRERYFEGLRRAGLPATPPLPLPDKPSIAVLPFENMSGDLEQEYFSVGIAEEIITALSKTPKLFVIARTSSFKYKGQKIDLRTIGKELGVRYILEGSIRKSDDKLRITSQLIDTTTNNNLWAERYDRRLKDIFDLQDEITLEIISALQVELTEGEKARISARRTKSLNAYLQYIQGIAIFLTITKDNNELARRIFENVIQIEPQFAPAYSMLGSTYMMDVYYDAGKSLKESTMKAMRLKEKAISLDKSYGPAHGSLGWLYTMAGKHEKGISEIERAIELTPNDSDAHMWMSYVLRLTGRNDEAVHYAQKALRLNPMPPSWYFRGLALNYIYEKKYDDAIKACQKGNNIAPGDYMTHITCAVAYSQAGKEDKAKSEVEIVLKLNPIFSSKNYAEKLPYKHASDRKYFVDAMLKAGLPD